MIVLVLGDAWDHIGEYEGLIVTDCPISLIERLAKYCQDNDRTYINGWGRDWLVKGKGPMKHVAPYRNIIRAFTDPVIVDPFMGYGSIGMAAHIEGRAYVGIENNERRFRIAVERISENTPPDTDIEIVR